MKYLISILFLAYGTANATNVMYLAFTDAKGTPSFFYLTNTHGTSCQLPWYTATTEARSNPGVQTNLTPLCWTISDGSGNVVIRNPDGKITPDVSGFEYVPGAETIGMDLQTGMLKSLINPSETQKRVLEKILPHP